jgi:hypothetical protein
MPIKTIDTRRAAVEILTRWPCLHHRRNGDQTVKPVSLYVHREYANTNVSTMKNEKGEG